MAQDGEEAGGGLERAMKDLGSGAAGGIAQVLIGRLNSIDCCVSVPRLLG